MPQQHLFVNDVRNFLAELDNNQAYINSLISDTLAIEL